MKWRNAGTSRLLCFDIENKPGTYGPGDYTHPKVTALAARFLDSDNMFSWCLTRADPDLMREQAWEFRLLWDAADMVVGHNIRRHDIRILNGFYTTLDIPILADKPTVDTYKGLPKMAGFSRSLENLCYRWGCPVEKVQMPEHCWEAAYDGVGWATDRMKHRAETDVNMNIWLFHELRRRSLLP